MFNFTSLSFMGGKRGKHEGTRRKGLKEFLPSWTRTVPSTDFFAKFCQKGNNIREIVLCRIASLLPFFPSYICLNRKMQERTLLTASLLPSFKELLHVGGGIRNASY
jgi:hypothetical protein